MSYIDTKVLKDHASHYVRTQPHFHYGDWDNMCISGKEIDEIIATCPTADVAPIVHGKWIKQSPDPEVMKAFHDMGLGKGMSVNSVYWTCSVCENWGTPAHKYCSSCGAKMNGER